MFPELGDLLTQVSFAKILYGWIAAFMIITKVVRQISSKVIFSIDPITVLQQIPGFGWGRCSTYAVSRGLVESLSSRPLPRDSSCATA